MRRNLYVRIGNPGHFIARRSRIYEKKLLRIERIKTHLRFALMIMS